MSDTVIVVPESEPEPVAVPASGADVAAGMALVTAEGAAVDAAQAAAVAEGAAVIAEMAMEEAVRCCAHCEGHSERLASLEEGRGAELAASLEQVELDAPAPPVREKPAPKPKSETPAPEKKRGFWPV
jgi:hypothetical protein